MIGARLLLLLSVHLRVMERAHGFSLVEWACPLSSPCRHQQRHTRAELHETCGPQGASFWGEGSNRPGRTRIAVHFRCDVTRLCAASSPTPSSSPTNAATELPDSLEDAAIRAAQASADWCDAAGMLARCRVDFDTTVGDETYTSLKSTTEFMQNYVTAVTTLLVPGVEERRRDEQMRLAEARAELKRLEAEADVKDGAEGESEGSPREARTRREQREEELIQIIQNRGQSERDPWTGPIARVYFPDEGNAALARRDWPSQVPPCVQFASCNGVQRHNVETDAVVFFYCPKASDSEGVEAILARHEAESTNLRLTVFVNPNLVDMGVTGFGLAGRMLRERLIDPLQSTYYLRTLPWGALTRQWPSMYSVWQEDETATGGYRLIQSLDRLPSNPEVEDIYDGANGGGAGGEGDGSGGPSVLNQLGDFINGMMRL